MCQILQTQIKLEKKTINNILNEHKFNILYLLNQKGGEEYSFTYFFDNSNYNVVYSDASTVSSAFDNFIQELRDLANRFPKRYVKIVFFSRQAPEMESQEGFIKPAPYLVNNKLVWMHGTVSNQNEIEQFLNKKFNVDSEVFGHWSQLLENNIFIKGVYTTYYIDTESCGDDWLYNGIGLWHTVENRVAYYEWRGTTPDLSIITGYRYGEEACYEDEVPYYMNKNQDFKNRFYVSFSGGMDVVMSTYAFISDTVTRVSGSIEQVKLFDSYDQVPSILDKSEFVLVYFNYGARARDYEIAAMKKFANFIDQKFPNIKIEHKIIDVKSFFNELSKINELESKLMNPEASGEVAETEDNLAYVPYRNTQFGILLGALIDRDLEKELFNPYVIYGLNLTEMGVYVDNTEVWLKSVQRAIRYGGKNYKKVDIIAPFVDTTKTNMLAFMIETYGYDTTKELLDIAFSCYYPKENGEPCGECGSCILRQKALKRANNKIKRKRILDAK